MIEPEDIKTVEEAVTYIEDVVEDMKGDYPDLSDEDLWYAAIDSAKHSGMPRGIWLEICRTQLGSVPADSQELWRKTPPAERETNLERLWGGIPNGR